MPAKIRLQRYGKKGQPLYHIVIADGRAPRDGKFIEQIGSYNPLTIPATIDINIDKAITWLNNGAKPTDTVNAILSYKGILYKNHLIKGVAKGALTTEQADAKFAAWQSEKDAKISAKINDLRNNKKSIIKSRLDSEVKINEARLAALAEVRAKEASAAREAKEAAAAAEAAANAPVVEAVAEVAPIAEVVVEAPVAEASAEVTPEASTETAAE